LLSDIRRAPAPLRGKAVAMPVATGQRPNTCSAPGVSTQPSDHHVSDTRAADTPAIAPWGRCETPHERADRNFQELIQEIRVVQTGVQVLFAFLLTVPMTGRIELTGFQRVLYFSALLLAGAAAILLLAPSSYHRIMFRRDDKEHLVHAANRFFVVGLACVGLTMIISIALVSDVFFTPWVSAAATAASLIACLTAWYVIPARRRRRTAAAAVALPSVRGLSD
jgi:hypothetical protein